MAYTNQGVTNMASRPMPQTQPFQFSQYQPQLSQPIFPQPSGNIYFVNNSLEVANIPVGVGTSAVLCLSENTIYLKSMQNGMPMLLAYRINPLEAPISNSTTDTPDAVAAEQPAPNIDYEALIKSLKLENEEKIKSLESTLSELKEKIGGLVECRF